LPVSPLLVRGQNGVVSVTPEAAGWRYVSFNALRIPSGGRFLLETEGSEACIVVLSGRCAVRVGEVGWPHVGERATPFDGWPRAGGAGMFGGWQRVAFPPPRGPRR